MKVIDAICVENIYYRVFLNLEEAYTHGPSFLTKGIILSSGKLLT